MNAFNERRPLSKRRCSIIFTGVALAASLLSTGGLLAQDGRSGERWVGTWATATVARPQPQAAAAGRGAPPAGAAQPQAPAGGRGGAAAAQPQAPAGGRGGAPAGAAQPQAPAGGRGGAPAGGAQPPLNFKDQTLRQIIHPTLGGTRVRIVLSNTFGTESLPIGAAAIALRDKGPAIVPQSARPVTFGGRPWVTISAGAVAISDPVDLAVQPLTDLAIDLYFPGDTSTSPLTTHGNALQTNYVSAPGNHVGAVELPPMATTAAWFFLARVDVLNSEATGAVVMLGDSITDGTRSTADTNNRWPDQFAKRLAGQPGGSKIGVLNAGIAGNRVLNDGTGPSALARFDREILVPSGVTHVVVMEGINDVGRQEVPLTLDDLITGHRQLIARAHAGKLKIYGATLTPFAGTTIANYYSVSGEAIRQALNNWIRTSAEYDGVIDFDAAIRDPADPTKALAQYDSGDHLHPNDAGYGAMANAIDLALFK